jgi:hypothetical protein
LPPMSPTRKTVLDMITSMYLRHKHTQTNKIYIISSNRENGTPDLIRCPILSILYTFSSKEQKMFTSQCQVEPVYRLESVKQKHQP